MFNPEQTRNRWVTFVWSLAPTLLGLGLIWVAMQGPAEGPQVLPLAEPATPTAYSVQIAVQVPVVAIETVPLRATPSPTARPLLGTGGPAEGNPSAIPLPLAVSLVPAPTPTPPRTKVVVYPVQRGDNVNLIAQRFEISPETIVWANPALQKDPDLLTLGQELYILPVCGVWHTVKEGDTLQGIASCYKVDASTIADYAPNRLNDDEIGLVPGRKLIIPGGVVPYVPRRVYSERGTVLVGDVQRPGAFIWPCYGTISQYFGPTHTGIDIAVDMDTPLYASAGGLVVQAGLNGSLGISVTIDHGNGYVTTYGHLDYLWVNTGCRVAQGDKIGAIGNTGKSTGPHVHFIIAHQGTPVDPMQYLPR